MIRMTKFTDYGVVLMTFIGGKPFGEIHNVRDLSNLSHLPQPMVQKVLKSLAKTELLESQRGVNGGYRLARPADQISLLDMMEALEGDVSLTECSSDLDKACSLEPSCPVCGIWNNINGVLKDALRGITLLQMTQSCAAENQESVAAITTQS